MGTLCLHEKKSPLLLGNEQSLWWCIHVEGSFRCPLSPQHQNPQKNPRTGQRRSLLMVCWEWAWVPLSERSRAECSLRPRLSPGESGQGLPPSSACLHAGAQRPLVQPLKVEHPSASRSTEGRHTPDREVSRRPWQVHASSSE